MKYIKLVNNIPINYTIEQFIEEYPEVKIYTKVKGIPDKNVLKQYDVFPVITTASPEITADTEVVEIDPQQNWNGEWIQQWEVKEIHKSIDDMEVEEEKGFKFPNLGPDAFATNEQRLERMNICQDCDRYRKSTRQCKECGCFMVLKAQLKVSACPLDKWGKLV
tara:strand:- start:8543 stop:9034 length:492 start_codon:yes stop_codon:yes gene_type:complete